jgi:hypothetical protein
MSEETDAAFRYRQHAEALRTIAGDSKDAHTKQMLLGIAADYESMANSMEAIDRTNQRLRRPG